MWSPVSAQAARGRKPGTITHQTSTTSTSPATRENRDDSVQFYAHFVSLGAVFTLVSTILLSFPSTEYCIVVKRRFKISVQ